MAWRPNENLIAGELDNTVPGRVTGWLSFVGMTERVTLDLEGDFHRDIRGTVLRLHNPSPSERHPGGGSYMEGFSARQTGKAGDITAGLPPRDYVGYPYVEFYSDENGRVVLELEPGEVEVVGMPRPWRGEPPIDRNEQKQNLSEFLSGLARGLAGSEV